jgi:hypothetical protein
MDMATINSMFKDKRITNFKDIVDKVIDRVHFDSYSKFYMVFTDGTFIAMGFVRDHDGTDLDPEVTLFEYDYRMMGLISEDQYQELIKKKSKLDSESRKRWEIKQLKELMQKYPQVKDCMVREKK